MPTLRELDDRVVARLGVNANDTRLTESVRFRAINEALRQVSLDHDWPWLATSETIATVNNQQAYTPTAGWIRTNSLVRLDNGTPLIQYAIQDLDRYNTSEQASFSGAPRVYAIYGGQILLGPVPNGVFNILHRYYRAETYLANSEDPSIIPDVYSRGIIEWASHELLNEVRETERAAGCLKDYQRWMERAQDNIKQSREPLRIRVRPGAWI